MTSRYQDTRDKKPLGNYYHYALELSTFFDAVYYDELTQKNKRISRIPSFEDAVQKIRGKERSRDFLIRIAYIIAVSILEDDFRISFERLINEKNLPYHKLESKIKLSISDIHSLQTTKFNIGAILSEFYNFQNLTQVSKAFGPLLNIHSDFFEYFKNYTTILDNISISDHLGENFISEIRHILKTRHNIVHHPQIPIIFDKNPQEILGFIFTFTSYFYLFVDEMSDLLLGVDLNKKYDTLKEEWEKDGLDSASFYLKDSTTL